MPFSSKFRNGMGFPKEGQVIGGFTVESVSVSHINISGGHYEYPTEMIVRGQGNASAVRRTFKEFYRARRTLFSGYGNPYQCRHGKMIVQSLGDSRFSIATQGTCVRVYLRNELARFLEYLSRTNQPITDVEYETTVAEYMKEYVKSSRKKNPFFG